MNSKIKIIISLIVLPLLIAGCNLFGFMNPTNSSSDYLYEGQKKYWEGDFLGAASDFTKAKEADSNNGDAYWWHAKALMRTTGHNTLSLITSISGIDTMDSLLPFMDWSADSANVLYQALLGVNDDLNMIYYDSVFSEELSGDDIAVDYASSLSLWGIIMLRDTNIDHVIDDNDFDLGAMFQDGEFIIPGSDWDLLSDAEKNQLIDNVVLILNNFLTIVQILVIDLDVEGVDFVKIEGIVNDMIDGLNGYRPPGL